MYWYLVTMTITTFLQSKCNAVIQVEFIDTKLANFGGLVTTFSRYNKTCKNVHISYGSNGRFISLLLKPKPFSSV